MEHKTFAVSEIKAGEAKGEFEALVSVFGNVDSTGDRVIPGAFTATLAKNPRPALVFSHQWGNPGAFIGETLAGKQTTAGLVMRGRLFVADGEDHQGAKSIYPALKAGMITNFSFAYDVVESAMVEENGEQIRELKQLDLFEWGPTLIGANQSTMLLQAPKSSDGREFIYLPTFATSSTNPVYVTQNFAPVKSDEPAPTPESPVETPAPTTIAAWRFPVLHANQTASR